MNELKTAFESLLSKLEELGEDIRIVEVGVDEYIMNKATIKKLMYLPEEEDEPYEYLEVHEKTIDYNIKIAEKYGIKLSSLPDYFIPAIRKYIKNS